MLGDEIVKEQINEWIKEKTNEKLQSINSKTEETQDPHMDGYAASLYSPVRLSIFSNTNTEKVCQNALNNISSCIKQKNKIKKYNFDCNQVELC